MTLVVAATATADGAAAGVRDTAPRVRHDVPVPSARSREALMMRMLIRIGVALLGAAIGFIVAATVLDDMTLDGAAFLIAVVIFVVLTAVLEPFIEKIGDEHLGLISTFSSLITTFLALLITELVSDGLSITGSMTWVLATLIVWASTALATLILVRMFVKDVRERR
jgi:Na+/melibiose symporter-like transporter